MGELLKRQYDLVALKVELKARHRRSSEENCDVIFTLQQQQRGELVNVTQWFAPLSSMVHTESSAPSPSSPLSAHYELPPTLVMGLKEWFHLNDEHQPLWVQLVSPSGVLRFLPWERALGSQLSVPILMLPDFIFPPPREAAAVLDVVVCAVTADGEDPGPVFDALTATIRQIRAVRGRRLRLHVFAHAFVIAGLQRQGHYAGDPSILFYEPPVSNDTVRTSTARPRDSAALRSPWLSWMRAALRMRSVDVVHFICRATLSRGRGSLLMTAPFNSEAGDYGAVGSQEIQNFLTQTGAWSTVFSVLPPRPSELGIRAIADDIAQNRPGPLMMYTDTEDSFQEALRQGYEFLYGRGRHETPVSQALFMYCQPYLANEEVEAEGEFDLLESSVDAVTSYSQISVQDTPLRAVVSSPLDPLFAKDDNVATWVASTERFAEQVQLQSQRLTREGIIDRGSTDERQMQTELNTVDELRRAVAEQVSMDGEEEAGGGHDLIG